MNLPEIASETHEKAVAYFKVAEQYGYKFIMEIKKIRDERFYKEIGFPSFEEYCESAWKTKRDSMDERIKIALEFGESFDGTYRQIGHSKSLMLARMEPEIRQQVETTIDVNQATVKALKQAEHEAKEAESRATKAEQEKYHYEKLWQQEKNKPAAIQTKTVEVVPESVKKQIEDKEFQLTNMRAGYQEAKQKLAEYELRNTEEFDAEQARIQREKLQHEADMNTINLRIAYKNFVEKAAITSFLQGAIVHANGAEKERLNEMVEAAQVIIDQTKLALRGRKLGVVT